jgi:serpin B
MTASDMTKARRLLVLFTLAAAACGSSPSRLAPTELRSDKERVTAPAVSADDTATLAADDLAFAIDMHLALRANQTGNFVFSQTSISTALAMLYAGAATTTATQMAAALHFSLPPERLHPAFDALDLALTTPPAGTSGAAFRLEVADSLFSQKGFAILPTFLDVLAEDYGAGMFGEDFMADPEAARNEINSWVSDRTEHQIPELFPQGSIDVTTRLVLANAVFFHGDWKTPFNMATTRNATFHAPAGDVSVPTMFGDHDAGLWSGTGWSAAALDYVGDTTSMIVVVPDAGTFDVFEAGLTASGLSAILAGARPGGGGDLVMPKFKFDTSVALADTLAALGMPDAFTTAADFSGIDGARDLAVQSVLHKAIIAVDEKGTTAAAATGISVGTNAVTPSLVVDRPFLFFIRHNPTGAILFQGRVLDPSK